MKYFKNKEYIKNEKLWLVTSVQPSKQEMSFTIFNHWKNIGAKIFTINSFYENKKLNRSLYENNSIIAKKDYSKIYERPLVSINEALKSLASIAPKGAIIGIVNSDIIPYFFFPWNRYISQISINELHIFKRTDFEKNTFSKQIDFKPNVYKYGYDLFLIKNEDFIFNLLSDDEGELAFGVPWWDYWFPCKAINMGLKVISVETCSIFHEKHKEQFSQELWKTKGVLFSNYFQSISNGLWNINNNIHTQDKLIKLCSVTINFIDTQKYCTETALNRSFKEGITIVSACMNRNNNLAIAITSWIKCEEINEIIIVDWGSEEPVSKTLTKNGIYDDRIKIISNSNVNNWNLCKAFNLGFKHVSFDKILKLDADVVLRKEFFNFHKIDDGIYYSGHWKYAKNDNEKRLNGSFFTKTKYIFSIGGYNEVIDSYGWDDSDIYQRLSKFACHKLFDLNYINHIPQTCESRVENSKIRFEFNKLHPSIFTELEIRRNEWKAFFNLPQLGLNKYNCFEPSAPKELEYFYALANEISKPYEHLGLAFSKFFALDLSIDALYTLFLFRHAQISWTNIFTDLLLAMTHLPFKKEDLATFINHPESPFFDMSLDLNQFPGIVKNEFLHIFDKENSDLSLIKNQEYLCERSEYYYNKIFCKSKKYRVAVPVTIFNAERFVDKLIENIEQQVAFTSCFFIFVIADGKKYQKINEFYDKYIENTEIIYLVNDPGLYNCWNFVIKSVRCEYISNWNVDDRRSPYHIAKMIKLLDTHKNIDAVCSALFVSKKENMDFDECLKKQIESWFSDSEIIFDHSDMFQKNWWSDINDPKHGTIGSQNYLHCMPVWRRALHEKNGYFDEDRYGASADWEFWLRCGINGSKYMKISEILGVYYFNESSYGRITPEVDIKEQKIINDYIKFSKIF